MNGKANEVLAQLMQRALDGVDAAVDFSEQQIPAVIEQLLTWKFVESLLWWLPAIAVLALWIFLTKTAFSKKGWAREVDGEVNIDCAGLWCFATIPCLGAFVGFANFEWLKIWLAPKLYLLEYGASLVK